MGILVVRPELLPFSCDAMNRRRHPVLFARCENTSMTDIECAAY